MSSRAVLPKSSVRAGRQDIPRIPAAFVQVILMAADAYSDLTTIYKAPAKNMTIQGVFGYADTYRCAIANRTQNDIELPAAAVIPKYFGYYFYQGLLKSDQMMSFTTSEYKNYLVDVLSGKMRALENIGQFTDFNKNVKYILLSGHEETIISLMKDYFPNPLETYPPFASAAVVSLTKENGKYYVTVEINGVTVSLGSQCKQATKCELSDVVFSLNEKVTKNIRQVCNDTKSLESQGLPIWAIMLMVVGGLVFIAVMITLFSIKIQKDRKKNTEEFKSTLINS